MSSAIAMTTSDFDPFASAEDCVATIQALLANGEAGAARHAVAEAVVRFPDHPWIKKASRIINPDRVVTGGAADAPDRSEEFAWLRENAPKYHGQWVALLGNDLLASGLAFEDVLQEVRARGLEAQALVHHIV